MRLHTARQIASDITGNVAAKVALSSGKSLETVQREAKDILRSAKKRERMDRKHGRLYIDD